MGRFSQLFVSSAVDKGSSNEDACDSRCKHLEKKKSKFRDLSFCFMMLRKEEDKNRK